MKIALFVGQIYIHTQREVIRGIYNECEKNGDELHLFSFYVSNDEQFDLGEYEYIKRMDLSGFDAFILYASAFYNPDIRQMLIDKIKNYKKPCVSIDNYIEGYKNITSCNYEAMKELVEHLVTDHGVKLINFVGGPLDSPDAQKRLAACKDVLKAHGLKLDNKRVYNGNYYIESGTRAYKYFKEHYYMDADAFVCVNDHTALGLYYELEKEGYKVPEKYLITGFDNIPRAAYNIPSITSVHRSERLIGKEAYNAILSNDVSVVKILPRLAKGLSCCKDMVMDPATQRKHLKDFIKLSVNNSRYMGYVNDATADLMAYRSIKDAYKSMPDFQDKFQIPTLALVLETEDGTKTIPYNYNLETKKQTIMRPQKSDIYHEENGCFYVYSSLHYGDSYYGYLITTNYFEALENELFHTFVNSVSNTIENIKKYNAQEEYIAKLKDISFYDPLTKLYNRLGFFNKTETIFEEAKTKNQETYIIFADLDGLKLINDTMGHKLGDEYIKDLSKIMHSCLGTKDIAMRYGGDEFVIFGFANSKEYIENKIKKINKKIEEFNVSGKYSPYILSVSMGYSIIKPDTKITLFNHIEEADKKMYKAKKEKKLKRSGNGERRSGKERKIHDRRSLNIEIKTEENPD